MFSIFRVVALGMSPINDSFLSGSLDKTLRLWDLRSQNCQVGEYCCQILKITLASKKANFIAVLKTITTYDQCFLVCLYEVKVNCWNCLGGSVYSVSLQSSSMKLRRMEFWDVLNDRQQNVCDLDLKVIQDYNFSTGSYVKVFFSQKFILYLNKSCGVVALICNIHVSDANFWWPWPKSI